MITSDAIKLFTLQETKCTMNNGVTLYYIGIEEPYAKAVKVKMAQLIAVASRKHEPSACWGCHLKKVFLSILNANTPGRRWSISFIRMK